jgi:hypothetical protein
MKLNGKAILFILVLIIVTTICKYFFGPEPGWSGFSPVIAIALFSGFILKERDRSFFVPLVALFISDAVIHILYKIDLFDYPGFYNGQWKNYLILLTATLIGWLLKGRSHASLLAGAIIAPTVFFLLSNFNVWLATTEAVYSKDFGGLMSCYVAGLPFYKNALIATLVFLPGIMFLYNYLTRNRRVLTLA